MEQGQISSPSCPDSTYFCFAVTVYIRRCTQRTCKIWIQRSTHRTANSVSLASAAFCLSVKPLKSNSFTDFKLSRLHSPAARWKLDYGIISNVITTATYAPLVPFVWKNAEIFGFACLIFACCFFSFFKESRVKYCCL